MAAKGPRVPRLCKDCGETDPEKFKACRMATQCTKCWRLRWKSSLKRSQNKIRRRQKLQVLTQYGPRGELRCNWEGCEVRDPDMLVIDHVEDNGADEKRMGIGRKGHELYRRLINENFPVGYQTLCCNHNHKKEILRSRNLFCPNLGPEVLYDFAARSSIDNFSCFSSDRLRPSGNPRVAI